MCKHCAGKISIKIFHSFPDAFRFSYTREFIIKCTEVKSKKIVLKKRIPVMFFCFQILNGRNFLCGWFSDVEHIIFAFTDSVPVFHIDTAFKTNWFSKFINRLLNGFQSIVVTVLSPHPGKNFQQLAFDKQLFLTGANFFQIIKEGFFIF